MEASLREAVITGPEEGASRSPRGKGEQLTDRSPPTPAMLIDREAGSPVLGSSFLPQELKQPSQWWLYTVAGHGRERPLVAGLLVLFLGGVPRGTSWEPCDFFRDGEPPGRGTACASDSSSVAPLHFHSLSG